MHRRLTRTLAAVVTIGALTMLNTACGINTASDEQQVKDVADQLDPTVLEVQMASAPAFSAREIRATVQPDASVDDVLTEVNKALSEDIDVGLFVTESVKVDLASAAHADDATRSALTLGWALADDDVQFAEVDLRKDGTAVLVSADSAIATLYDTTVAAVDTSGVDEVYLDLSASGEPAVSLKTPLSKDPPVGDLIEAVLAAAASDDFLEAAAVDAHIGADGGARLIVELSSGDSQATQAAQALFHQLDQLGDDVSLEVRDAETGDVILELP